MSSQTSQAETQKPRKRVWKPKSTKGCITCKIRRVKCDEAKPHCHRCVSTGRNCDGYTGSSHRPSTYTPRTLLNQAKSVVLHPSSSLHPSTALQSSPERESFHFFESYAHRELSGILGYAFWDHEILQAAQNSAAIRYTTIALGAMHRRYIGGTASVLPDDPSDRQLQFALQESNRAIRELVGSPKDRITAMTTCLLFHTMACLQGHHQEALNHVRSAIRMLREVDEERDMNGSTIDANPVSVESLRHMIVSLDFQARSVMSQEDLLNWEPPPRWGNDVPITAFSSLQQASLYYQALLNAIIAFLQEVIDLRPPQDMELVANAFSRLGLRAQSGSMMLDDLLARISSHSDGREKEASMLVLLYRAEVEFFCRSFEVEISAASADANFANTGFDEDSLFNEMMEWILQLMEPADGQTGQSPRSPIQPNARPAFSPSNGPLAAAWLVATRAPNYNLRKNAIDLMLRYPRREGVWDGRFAGRIAQKVMRLEESSAHDELGDTDGASLRVPHHLRVLDVVITHTGMRACQVQYRNVRNMERNERGHVEHISW